MSLRTRLIFAALIALLGLAATTGFAQMVSGTLTGTVYDASGATVPNATVAVRNEATGVENTTTTTSTGEYRLNNLPVGTYTLVVGSAGFAKSETKNVAVQLNVTGTQNITLAVGKAAETVEVSATAVSIDTTTAQLQNSFNTQQLMELPTASSGSGVINLSLLAAGVATSGSVGLGSGPTVGGQRPRNNNFTVEGLDNNSGSVTGPLVFVPNDAVAEFTFLQNQFGADFGHSSGGQFNQVIKSGTNEFHGAAYDYMYNRNLDAADNLSAVEGNPLHPRYDNNRFGGIFGGPIKKNKLFFFVNYEYNPIGSTATGGTACAPTAAGYNALAGIPGINQTNLGVLKQYAGTASAAADVNTCGYGSPILIGPDQQSVNGPAGTAVEAGLIGFSAPSFTNNEYAATSIDYNISDKDSIRGRFILNRSGFIDGAGFPSVFYQTVPYNYYLLTFSEFHTFSPTVVNEFRAGYNRYSNNYGVGDLKFPGLDAFPNILLFELGGVNIGPDPNAPQFGYQNQYQLSDNLSWTKGAHTLKFGFDGWDQISPQSFTQRARGDYDYSYLSDYLFDYIPDYLAQRSLGNSVYYGNRQLLGWYANDNWKIKPNLTLTLGVRYEYQTVPLTENGQVRNAISNVPGLITFNSPQAQTNAIMPRVGIAYSPGTSGRTSIRAGYGLFYDVLYDNQGLLSLPPQASTTADVTGNPGQGFLANGGILPTFNTGTLDQATARALTSGYVPKQIRPQTSSWNVGIQHVFRGDYTVESRYVGTHSVHLSLQDQINRSPVVTSSFKLPVYVTAPSQATLDALTTTTADISAAYGATCSDVGYCGLTPEWLNAGFQSSITAWTPTGRSIYHGWQNSLSRRFSNGLQFNAAYTLSHAIDDSTADFFSTYVTPRRPSNFRNLNLDRSNSALDHRQRFSLQILYDLPIFKHSNWFLKNVVGNWEFAPIYYYQSGSWATIQSGTDSNRNGDTAGDRVFVNPGGQANVGSNVTALHNSNGDTVAYVADDPNARYIQAPRGTFPTAGRNTAQLPAINDVDLTIAKSFNFTEAKKLQFSARFINVLNHPQYVGGNISDVAPTGGAASGAVHSLLEPTSGIFLQPAQAFSSNPRTLQLALKFIF